MKLAVRSTLPFQVPSFVVEENPLFMEFLDAYYEWLEQEGQSLDYIRNALSFLDVDQTLDRFINFFWEEVRDIPLDAVVDRRLLAKHIYDLYQSKGTIKSYKLLFRILYDEDVEIYTPKLDMLRVSDGKWEVSQTIRSTTVSGDPFGLIGLTLKQSNPVASVLVQNVIELSYGTEKYYDIHVESGSKVGVMRPNEEASAVWTDENGNQQTITVFLPVAPAELVLRDKGKYYSAGETVNLIDTTSTDFQTRVEKIGSGSINGVMILDGGSGYSVGDVLAVDNTGTSGTNLRVRVAAVDAGVITKIDVVDSGQGYYSLPVITGANGGTFLPTSNDVGHVLDVFTSSIGRNHSNQIVESTLSTAGLISTPVGTFIPGESLTLLDECLMTENYFSLLAEDGTRILTEDTVGQTTAAKVVEVLGNQITLSGLLTRRAIEQEGSSSNFLAEDGGVMINEQSSADLNRRTIVGATSGATCRILDMHPADVRFDPGVIAMTGRRFTNNDGKISEVTKKIQDSKFYQEFSYVIKSSQPIDVYRNIVQKLIHPAGFALFGEIHAERLVQLGLSAVEVFLFSSTARAISGKTATTSSGALGPSQKLAGPAAMTLAIGSLSGKATLQKALSGVAFATASGTLKRVTNIVGSSMTAQAGSMTLQPAPTNGTFAGSPISTKSFADS